ncbi:retrovirus-related pol polyprotein from transposon TNT 1-94 [Tanacetum coccineum]|uniref:Retrovirus-related pol polyprotein from transposon TNT 1-94 n=1 Tax=Tanacetum coccineum TaxID=301880 RepID=A0ABQ4XT25_9ASTR
MSNTNTNLQTHTSNALHNAIMEAGGKDRPPMLAPGNYVQWKSRIKRYIDTKPNNELIHYCLQNPPYKFKWTEKTVPVAEGSSETTTEGYMENYKNVSQYIQDQLDAEAEAVQIILTGIDNDIYFTVDACPNACEMWKAIERLKQARQKQCDVTKQQVNVQFLTSTSTRCAKFCDTLLMRQPVYHPQNHPTHNNQYSSTRSQQATRNRGKAIVNSSAPIYDQEPAMKIYKPTNNNLRTSSNTSRANQDNSPRISRGTRYENQRAVNVAGAMENVEEAGVQLNAEQADWKDDTDDESDDQDQEARYMYMPQYKRTIQPIVVPISTREPKHNVNQSIETSSKKTVATDSTVKKSRNITRKLYEQLVEIILFIVDSGCSKHMIGNLKLLTKFMEKFLGMVKFGNDQIAPIFGSCRTDLYTITLQDTPTSNPICLMAKATSYQAWLWHRRLSHLNFDTINLLLKNNIVNGLPKLKFVKDHLCSSCELGKVKRKSFHTKTTPSSKRRLQLLHMDLCGPMRVESINGKKYVLVIVDDCSRYT